MLALAVLSILLIALTVLAAMLSRSLIAARTRLSHLERCEADLMEAKAALVSERKARGESDVELARAEERLAARERGDEERAALLRAEIESLSNRIFEEKAGRFKEIGSSAISELVAPVRENLDKLQKALTESETKDAVREQSLREALERVGQINAKLGSQADNLAKALRSDNKMVGDFGEEILERLLEYAGLRRGVNFVEQGVDLDLKAEDGVHLMPDVVIFLPENRCLVVDSKMSLKSWTDAQTDDEVLRSSALDNFRRSVRAHVDGLASKPYTEALSASGRGVVDFKFLFIPVESAFHACLQLDRALYQYAFDRKVILTSPTTLLAVLTTVSHTWKQFEIGRNAEAIRDRAGLLLDKLHDFFASMEKVGEQLARAQDAYDTARKRLSTGNGNLIRQATMLKELKVDSTKQLPRSLEALDSSMDDA